MTLLFSKVIVMRMYSRVQGTLYQRCGAAATNASRFDNRYRYNTNSIINKGLLSLVGFRLFAAGGCSVHRQGHCDLFYSHV